MYWWYLPKVIYNRTDTRQNGILAWVYSSMRRRIIIRLGSIPFHSKHVPSLAEDNLVLSDLNVNFPP